jgi:hypothetical protein
MSSGDARENWAALPHSQRFRACRMALVGKPHPDPVVREAAKGWAVAVLSDNHRSWTNVRDVLLNVTDLLEATGPSLSREDVLDGATEHDHNWAVRLYARRLTRLSERPA